MKSLNNRGAVLIVAYMVLFILMAFSSSVALFNFSELNDARRYRNSTAAFWLAHAGIHYYLADPEALADHPEKKINTTNGTIHLSLDDSNSKYRLVTARGTVRGSQRRIQIKFPALSTIFERSVLTKGNLSIEGKKSSVIINDKLRLGGSILNTAAYPLVIFEDVREKVADSLVSVTYPDADHNGVDDEFSDFVAFNRSLVAKYSDDEIIYIQGNDTYTITPDSSLENKKIIYIEGDQEGEGHAIIQYSGALKKGQSLTVIATGTVTHNQAGFAHGDTQLNIIAWSDYYETSGLPSVHNGIVYTHGTAYFDEMHETSVTNGTIIANGGIVMREIWSTKTFNYADMRHEGIVPPGFEGLVGGGRRSYALYPNMWREI